MVNAEIDFAPRIFYEPTRRDLPDADSIGIVD
jgi:hypothetical protein